MRAMDLAHYIVEVAHYMKDPVSNLKLLKIMYFIHRDFSDHNKKLIEDQEFEAWTYGPVIPQVYYEFSIHVARPIRPTWPHKSNAKEPIKGIRKRIEEYVKKLPWELVQESHRDDGAWKKVYREYSREKISHELIMEEKRLVHGE